MISFPGWRQKSSRSILLSAYTRVFVLDMISFTVSNIGLLSYSPVLGLTNREVETVNTSSLKSHSPFDASTICVFATFEPRLTSNCVRFVPGRRLYTERTVTWNSYLSAFHPLDFMISLLLLVGPVVPPVPLRRENIFLCVCRRMRCRRAYSTQSSCASFPNKNVQSKRGRALFFFSSWQRETIFFA